MKLVDAFPALAASALLFVAATVSIEANAAEAQLKLPSFAALADKASESISITLDPALLGMAARFLDPAKPEDAAAKAVIAGLKGIYVRSFTFDTDFAWPRADVEAVRKQLAAPGWQQLVRVRSRKQQSNVDIYILVDGRQAKGLAIIASEPREFTIVNIVGSIDMQKLHEIEGQFGIPRLELEDRQEKAR